MKLKAEWRSVSGLPNELLLEWPLQTQDQIREHMISAFVGLQTAVRRNPEIVRAARGEIGMTQWFPCGFSDQGREQAVRYWYVPQHPFQPIATREEALSFLGWLVEQLPDGFHPEDDLRTTSGPTLPELFLEPAERRRLECFEFLDDICLSVLQIEVGMGIHHLDPETERKLLAHGSHCTHYEGACDSLVCDKENSMTQEDFDNLLEDIVNKLSGEQILAIPGIYEVLAEHFNNEVIEEWEDEHYEEEEDKPEESDEDETL